MKYLDFNTSHVNVNLHEGAFLILMLPYFNTSHVNVNPEEQTESDLNAEFQYISC